jgi:hypothetical protein
MHSMTLAPSGAVHSLVAGQNPRGKLLSRSVQQRQIKKLSARHHEIIERLILGQRPLQISQDLGIGRPWISIAMNSPLFQQSLQRRLSQISEQITCLTLERCSADAQRRLEMQTHLKAAALEAIDYLRTRAQQNPKGWEAQLSYKKRLLS